MQKGSILIVDDEVDLEPLIRQRFRKEIEAGKYEFSFAQTGKKALEIIKKNEALDIVVTDIDLPDMEGLEFLEKLMKLGRLIKPIIISSYGDMENIRAAMSCGASDVVTKPVDFDDFKMTISRTLEQLETLRNALEARTKFIAISQELDVASRLQQAILPKVFIDQKQVQLHGIMRPATEVGGDFYDFFWLDKQRLGVVMADVSGKGITAALFMAVSRTHLKAIAPYAKSPKECLINLNDELSKDNETAMFVTTFYGELNINTGELAYSNGGHCLPVLIDAKGKATFMDTTPGMGVGIMEGIEFGENKVKLKAGDAVFLYTDGVTEAMNPKHEEYTGDRLLKSLAKTNKHNMADMITKVVKDVDKFASGAEQSDDITCLSFRYKGK